MVAPLLAITGFGMATSLGDGETACAAARAGMSRAAPLKFAVADPVAKEPAPVLGHTVGSLTGGFAELGLAVRLASLALGDLLVRTPLEAADLASTAVLINLGSGFYFQAVDQARAAQAKAAGTPPPAKGTTLTDGFAATLPLYSNGLVDKVFRALGLPAPAQRQVAFGDQAGIAGVIAAAQALLAGNRVSACLVGGVDSLVEPRWLRACNELHLLKTALRPIGLMPGEAGAFLLLEKVRSRRPPLALIAACESGREAGHRFSDPRPVGRALAEVVRRAVAGNSSAREAAIICDLNGDAARASDFGNALVQLQPDLQPRATVVPAVSFGDTRAASGFLGTGLALRAFARGYAPGKSFVISSAGDDGSRSALLVTAPS
jgi:3-oxoacyl-[acyl-carrier-protein] synthase-1